MVKPEIVNGLAEPLTLKTWERWLPLTSMTEAPGPMMVKLWFMYSAP